MFYMNGRGRCTYVHVFVYLGVYYVYNVMLYNECVHCLSHNQNTDSPVDSVSLDAMPCIMAVTSCVDRLAEC